MTDRNLDLFSALEAEAQSDVEAAARSKGDVGPHSGAAAGEPEVSLALESGAVAEATSAAGTAPGSNASSPATGSEPEVLTVTEVNRGARVCLERGMGRLWVCGEVANFSRQRSGHCYFTLKDDRAQLRCVLFRSDAERLPVLPDDGTSVRAFGALTVYEARGTFQLVVLRLEASDGEALWRLAFERTRKKLEAEGLFAPERKRPLPRFPEVVGVVTSPTGAALRDIIAVARRRAPWLRLVLRGTRVQGEGAGREIARALGALGRVEDLDLVIVSRGGGSIEDLWGFNEEVLARAIAACPVPVISGVGHEVDVTISDLVADLRAPTPSAAAEAALPDVEVVERLVANSAERLKRGLLGQVERRRWRLGRSRDGLARLGQGLVVGRRTALDRLLGRLEGGIWETHPAPNCEAGRASRRDGGKVASVHVGAGLRGASGGLSCASAERGFPGRVGFPTTGRGRDRALPRVGTSDPLVNHAPDGGQMPTMPTSDADAGGDPGLETRLKRLEVIVAALDADDLELEHALQLFEEGVGHVKRAQEQLKAAELKVEELIEAEGDELREVPLQPADG